MPPSDVPPSDVLRHGRVFVCLLFATLGLTQGSWAARIPDVRDQLTGMTDAHWGALMLFATAGSLLSLALTLVAVGRVGPRRLAAGGVAVALVAAPLLTSAHSTVVLVAGLVTQGFAGNLLANAMNAQAVEVERGYRRRIMSSFHAVYSAGQLTGGVVGIAAAGAHVSPPVQLTVTSTVLAVLLLLTRSWAPPAAARPPRAPGRPLHRRLSPQLGLLALIALLSSVNEGAAVQWSALFTSHALHAGPAAGAATFSCFSIAMTATRLGGDRVVQRVGRRTFLSASALVSAAGMALAVGVGTPAAALTGFALLGAGTGCMVPTVYSLAGNQPGLTAGEGVAVAALGQWPAFLLGPPLIGALSSALGLRTALLLLVVTSCAMAAAARWTTEPVTPVPAPEPAAEPR